MVWDLTPSSIYDVRDLVGNNELKVLCGVLITDE
jgi:hypothetical protein